MTTVPDGRHDAPSGEHEQKSAARDEVGERVDHGAGEAQAAVGEAPGGGAGGKSDEDDEKHARPEHNKTGGASSR
jgi:hypothetical protein